MVDSDPFIDFDRTFVEIDKNAMDLLALGHHWGRRLGDWLTWEDVLQHRRVVLLAEAGAGKSREFAARSEALNLSGKFSLCLSVISLAEQKLDELVPSELQQPFADWLADSSDASFFLDSVDEARMFTTARLEQALASFRRAIPKEALCRAKIFISCRASDWRWKEDSRLVDGLSGLSKPAPDSLGTPDEILLDALRNGRKRSTKARPTDELQRCVILQLTPLAENDWRLAASVHSLASTEEFVKAVYHKGLDQLAARPGDLFSLIRYWRDNNRLGTLSEMIEHNIEMRLTEENREREIHDAICAKKLRSGAEKMAGAPCVSIGCDQFYIS